MSGLNFIRTWAQLIFLSVMANTLVPPLGVSLAATTPDCEKWFFETVKADPGTKDCEIKCASAMTGMDSFICPTQCKELCKLYLDRYVVDELTYSYSLSAAEKRLITKYPKDALLVFLAKREAEQSTKRIFGQKAHNDEGDAFRHFLWSGLVTNKIGEDRARLFLDTHETGDPNQPLLEKEMDTFNNEQGIKQARQLQKEGIFSTENQEREALKVLRGGKLKVLEPVGTVPDWR